MHCTDHSTLSLGERSYSSARPSGAWGTDPAPQGAQAPLGNTTVNLAVFSSPSVRKVGFSPDDPAVLARLNRYELQAVSRALLPDHRVRTCLVCRVPNGGGVKVLYSAQRQCARLGGLMVCGSLWVCPLCALKISEVRREELARGNKWWRAQGGVIFLVSLTVSHSKHEPLDGLLERLLGAYRWMTRQRSYKALVAHYGVEGTIRATEVTWGAVNGWHPHFHVEVLARPGVSRSSFEDAYAECWLAAAARHGFIVERAHAVNVKHTNDAVDKYVAKFGRAWSVEDELTKSHSKRGRRAGFTPFDLLRRIAETGESWPAVLFREYAAAFYRKPQLVWSDGLKKRAGIGHKSDEQIVEHDEEEALWAELLGLTDREWFAVRYFNMRGQLVEVARTGDAAAVRFFVRGLVSRLS